MQTVSVIIPALFPSTKLEHDATSLSRYPSVGEVTIVVNTTGADKDENTVHWRFLGKNKGFTGACNVGARVATGEYLLFLNDDCEMSEDALQKMVEFLEQNEDAVATQPIVTKVPVNSNSRQVENIGFWVDTRVGKADTVTVISDSKQEHQDIKEGSLHPRSARSRDDIAQSKDIENIGFWVDTKIGKAYPVIETLNSKIEILREKDRSIYGLSGTCLLIRKDIFEKVGMWDESFHSYLEDVDFAIRLHKAGYKVAPCLDAEVTHEHMATSSKMGLYKEKQDVKNWWRLTLKHPDVFIRNGNIFPLLVERARNMSGLVKKILQI